MLQRCIIYFLSFIFLHLMLETFSSHEVAFFFDTFFMIGIAAYEIKMYLNKYDLKALVSAFSIGTVFVVTVPFGLTNLLFLNKNGQTYRIGESFFGEEMFFWLSKASFWAVLSLITIWSAYNSHKSVSKIYFFTTKQVFGSFPFRSLENPRINWLLIIYIIVIVTRIYAISQGIYGYTGQNKEAYINLLQFISILNAFPKLMLFLLAYRYFQKPSLSGKVLLYLLVASEIFFGLLSGFKSQLVFPVIVMLIAYLMAKGMLRYRYILVSVFLIIAAYTLVEPMRAGYTTLYGRNNLTPSLMEILELTTFKQVETVESDRTTFDAFAERNHLTVFAALSFKHYASYGLVEDLKTDEKLFLSPLIAYIPRALWFGEKPLSNEGNIFYRQVLGVSGETSVTPGYIGFTILGFGSPLFILISVYFFGLFLRYLDFFYVAGGGAMIIFIAFLPTVFTFNFLHTIIIELLRMLPVYFLLQFVLLKPRTK